MMITFLWGMPDIYFLVMEDIETLLEKEYKYKVLGFCALIRTTFQCLSHRKVELAFQDYYLLHLSKIILAN